MSDIIVDFVIVGKPKCGTTALAHFLSGHPEVCISKPKEPNFFATDHIRESDEFHGEKKHFPIRTLSEYRKCFSHCQKDQIVGEASPRYLNSKESAKNIYEHNPEAKIIIMIRNPVDFMYSEHRQLVNACIEDEKDFEKALDLEKERMAGRKIPKGVRYPSHLFYTERAKFYKEIKRYMDIFPREHIFIMTNEEFNKDNRGKYAEVLRFLEVDPDYTPSFKKINSSRAARIGYLNKIFSSAKLRGTVFKLLGPQLYSTLANVGRSILFKKQQRKPLDPSLRRDLNQLVIGDAEKLGNLLNRNLVEEWGLDSSKR